MTTRYEADLQDHEPRKVHGVRGLNCRPFTRTFKNWQAMDKWLQANSDDCEIYSIER